MKSHHVTWVCVLGVSTVAGVLVGTLSSRNVEPEAVVEESPAGEFEAWTREVPRNPPRIHDLSPFPRVRMADLENDAVADDGTTLPEPPAVLPPAEDAAPIAGVPPKAEPADDTNAPNDPAPTDEQSTEAGPDDAARNEDPADGVKPPAPPAPANDRLVREMIASALPNISADEREAWFQELRGLPPNTLAEVLRIRKFVGSIVPRPRLPDFEPVAPVPTPAAPEVGTADRPPAETIVVGPATPVPPDAPPAPPAEQPRPAVALRDAPSLERALEAIRQAQRIHAHNLANVRTAGFRRRSPILGEHTVNTKDGAGEAAGGAEVVEDAEPCPLGTSCQLIGTVLDTTEGRRHATGRPLDVAIRGDGFLQFERDDGKTFYSRAGRLGLDADRRIVSAAGDVLSPSITCPEGTLEILVQADGTVQAETEDGLVDIGQIELARFTDPSALAGRGGALLAETSGTGRPTVGRPGDKGFGTLRTGFLEASNVDLETEMHEIDRLRKLESLYTELLGRHTNPNLAGATPRPSAATPQSPAVPRPGPKLVVRPDMQPN